MPDIAHQFQIRSSCEHVFSAIATAEGLNAWWTLESEGTPELNCVYRFYFGPQYDWQARVIEVVTNRTIEWQMEHAMPDWLPTKIGFALKEIDGTCIVHFSHRGWKSESEHFAITNFCWGRLLYALKEYVEQSVVVPFENRS